MTPSICPSCKRPPITKTQTLRENSGERWSFTLCPHCWGHHSAHGNYMRGEGADWPEAQTHWNVLVAAVPIPPGAIVKQKQRQKRRPCARNCGRNTLVQDVCSECRGEEGERQPQRQNGSGCHRCEGMSWRRPLTGCDCGLHYAPEARSR